ncbi:MAG: hypothetical protein DMF63_00920 [Acidobacteria bacterium]|nr:MAG: hypothetical protein DMF63_00920 [Acidobacteriota bacterium]
MKRWIAQISTTFYKRSVESSFGSRSDKMNLAVALKATENRTSRRVASATPELNRRYATRLHDDETVALRATPKFMPSLRDQTRYGSVER